MLENGLLSPALSSRGGFVFSVWGGTLSGFRFNGPPTQGSSCLRWELRRGRRSSQPWAGGRNPFGIGKALNTYEEREF